MGPRVCRYGPKVSVSCLLSNFPPWFFEIDFLSDLGPSASSSSLLVFQVPIPTTQLLTGVLRTQTQVLTLMCKPFTGGAISPGPRVQSWQHSFVTVQTVMHLSSTGSERLPLPTFGSVLSFPSPPWRRPLGFYSFRLFHGWS